LLHLHFQFFQAHEESLAFSRLKRQENPLNLFSPPAFHCA
jgi:hypothetical protein